MFESCANAAQGCFRGEKKRNVGREEHSRKGKADCHARKKGLYINSAFDADFRHCAIDSDIAAGISVGRETGNSSCCRSNLHQCSLLLGKLHSATAKAIPASSFQMRGPSQAELGWAVVHNDQRFDIKNTNSISQIELSTIGVQSHEEKT